MSKTNIKTLLINILIPHLMLYLDSNDVAPVDIQPWLNFGEKNGKPVADCLDIIWSRRKQII